MRMNKALFLLLLIVAFSLRGRGQEVLLPLQSVPGPQLPAGSVVSKSATESLRLPFFEDFSDYLGIPDLARWQPSGALVNRDYDPLPPTVGMVTLDALDAQGNLYPHASVASFPADTLASRSLRLDSIWEGTPRPLRLSDSLCLSFYYLPGGGDSSMWMRVGSCPSPSDTLILEFWNPSAQKWSEVWHTGGIPVDTLKAHTGLRWQHVVVKIDSLCYLSPDFAFRFRNYCSLDDIAQPGMVGNTDQWLIDYVSVNVNGSVNNHYSRDVAFVSPAPSFLNRFQSMPARQFQQSDMASEVSMTITNLYSQQVATHYSYNVYSPDGSRLSNYDGGYANAPTFLPGGNYQSNAAHATPPVNFSFPVSSQPAAYTIEHVVSEGVGGDEYPQNDTVRFVQVFDNYYAYDDGVPENGYGVVSTAAAQVSMAMLFPINVDDTLTAIDLYFNRTRNAENESVGFYLTVWSDEGGHPGDILYSDMEPRQVVVDGLNRYHRYILEKNVVVSGRVYVGFVQTSSDFINLGFDRNHDVSDRIFYCYGGDWKNTVVQGALMIRPCFGQRAVVGIEGPVTHTQCTLSLYPNPTTDCLNLTLNGLQLSAQDECDVVIYNSLGQQVRRTRLSETLHVGDLPCGIYLLRVVSNSGQVSISTKFVKQ